MLQAARRQVDDAVAGGRLGAGDLVVLTSGSTARPRGVVRAIASWEASVVPFAELTGLTPDDRVWVPGPLSSSLSLHAAWHTVQAGASPVLGAAPDPEATVLHGVPAALETALDAADDGRLPALRLAVVAGDVLPGRVRERAARRGWAVLEYYGAAELSFVAWRADDGPFRPFPGADVDVRDGVVWVRSPYLARGYLEEDDTGPLRRDGAWASVGDRAEAVPGGLRLLGRGGTAVTTGGHTVMVEEVEQVLRASGLVGDVAVAGAPHAVLGAVVVAVVVGSPATRRDLTAAVRDLPPPARPRRWLVAETLPRTAGGKLDRSALADLVRAGTLPGLP